MSIRGGCLGGFYVGGGFDGWGGGVIVWWTMVLLLVLLLMLSMLLLLGTIIRAWGTGYNAFESVEHGPTVTMSRGNTWLGCGCIDRCISVEERLVWKKKIYRVRFAANGFSSDQIYPTRSTLPDLPHQMATMHSEDITGSRPASSRARMPHALTLLLLSCRSERTRGMGGAEGGLGRARAAAAGEGSAALVVAVVVMMMAVMVVVVVVVVSPG